MSERRNRIDRGDIAVWGIIILITVGLFLAARTDATKAGLCPPGHDLAIERPGPYYVYTPNLPAGYSIVWVDDVATVLPPPGTYGTEGSTVRVCYTGDIYGFAASIPTTTSTTVALPPVAVTQYCEVDGVPGIVHPVDGCYTVDDYDRDFPEAGPVGSRAVSPSERPRVFGGVALPSFAVVVSRSVAL